MIRKDVLRACAKIKGGKLKKIVGCFCSPGVHAVVIFRFGKWIKERNIILRIFFEPIYIYLNHRIRSKWGIDIPRSVEIGEGFYIGHFGGITIGGSAKIGKNVSISQLVVIGKAGRGEKKGTPVIGDNVYIAPGAKIVGKIHISNNVKIGANAVVYKDIPENAIVGLSPGFKIISFKGNRSDLRHTEDEI